MREELEKSGQNNPSAEITILLEKVLKLNNFTFRDLNYMQIKGTAIGTRASPIFANVYICGPIRRPVCIPGTLVGVHIGLDTVY